MKAKEVMDFIETEKALLIVIADDDSGSRVEFYSKGLNYLERLGLLHECTIGNMKNSILDKVNDNISEIRNKDKKLYGPLPKKYKFDPELADEIIEKLKREEEYE